MKKFLVLMLAGAIMLGASSCAHTEEESSREDTDKKETVTSDSADNGTDSEESTETSAVGGASSGDDTTESDTAETDTAGETPDNTDPSGDVAETPDTGDAESAAFDYNSVLDENGFFKDVKASDIVLLPTYIGVDIDKSEITPTKEEVDTEVNYYFQNYPQYKSLEADRVIENGDTVNIDYVGSIDGVPFDGGSTNGQGTYVTIGVTSYIDDFLEQLIGHKPGETVNVEVTFPDDYHSEDLQGKDAVFVTVINNFGEPDYDGFAQLFGFADETDMRDYLNDQIYYSKVAQCVGSLLGEAICEEIPQSVIDYATESQIDYMVSMYSQYGMTRDMLLTAFGYESTEAYFEDNKESIMSSAALSLAFQAVAEIEGLSVTDEYYEQMGITDQDIAAMGRGYLNQNVIMSALVPDFIIDNANITE